VARWPESVTLMTELWPWVYKAVDWGAPEPLTLRRASNRESYRLPNQTIP